MDRALDLAAVRRIAAACCRIIFGEDLDNLPLFILTAPGAANYIRGLQTHFIAGEHSEIAFEWFLEKIALLNPQITGESHFMSAVLRAVWIVLNIKFFRLPFRIICYG